MDTQDDNTYLCPLNNGVLRETQTKGSETYALPTYNEVRMRIPSTLTPYTMHLHI